MATDNTGSTNASGIFARSRVDDGINNNLDGVLVRQKMDDFQGVLNDSDGHELLTVVASLLHEAADKTLNDRARSLTESLLLVSSSGVRKVNSVVALACDVIL